MGASIARCLQKDDSGLTNAEHLQQDYDSFDAPSQLSAPVDAGGYDAEADSASSNGSIRNASEAITAGITACTCDEQACRCMKANNTPSAERAGFEICAFSGQPHNANCLSMRLTELEALLAKQCEFEADTRETRRSLESRLRALEQHVAKHADSAADISRATQRLISLEATVTTLNLQVASLKLASYTNGDRHAGLEELSYMSDRSVLSIDEPVSDCSLTPADNRPGDERRKSLATEEGSSVISLATKLTTRVPLRRTYSGTTMQRYGSGSVVGCSQCKRGVYLGDRVLAEGLIFHRDCFRCAQCDVQLFSCPGWRRIGEAFYCQQHYLLLRAERKKRAAAVAEADGGGQRIA